MDQLHDIEVKDDNQKTQNDLPDESDTPKQDTEVSSDNVEDEEKALGKKKEKKGRRKIKIEFITDKSRRHITFSKRKSGIMKKVCGFPNLIFFLSIFA